ncbi:hypothetical protein ACFWC6_30900, partial [Micromonospora chalcea]
ENAGLTAANQRLLDRLHNATPDLVTAQQRADQAEDRATDLANRLHRAEAEIASHAKAVTAWANQVEELKRERDLNSDLLDGAAKTLGLRQDGDDTIHAHYKVPDKVAELVAEVNELRATLQGPVPAANDDEPATTPDHVIWSNHHKAWWGPNGSGYRTNPHDAGRYTLPDTEKWLGRGCYCCQVPELPIPAEKITNAGDRAIRSVIAAATRAAVKAGKANKHYNPAEVA